MKDFSIYFQVPNRFIRISPKGRISYSQRLTVKARCQMDLRKFPLDKQTCPLQIGSFGYDAGNIIYKQVIGIVYLNDIIVTISFILYKFLVYSFINFFFYFAVARFSRKPLSWVDKEKLGLAQYYIVNWAHGSSVGTTRRTGNSLNMSTVFFEFSFQRRTGFFLLQVNSFLNKCLV